MNAVKFPVVNQTGIYKNTLAMQLLRALDAASPDKWSTDPQVLAYEAALLLEMIGTPEKALVVSGRVIVVIMHSGKTELGVYDL